LRIGKASNYSVSAGGFRVRFRRVVAVQDRVGMNPAPTLARRRSDTKSRTGNV
jgi:hypothetical protein